jgi:hypothetical protein
MRDFLKAALFLLIVLNLLFFPVLWGNKTLLLSSRDAPSVTQSGAFHQENYTQKTSRTVDAGAPAWTIEPWFKIISKQYWRDHVLPLWNPYAAYGKPLAAAQQAQPFYPLTVLESLHVTPRTYDFFIVGRLFVGGLLMFLFANLFLEFVPAIAAGVTYMLSGYFMIFLNMPHLSVELLAPGILWTFERVMRRNCWGSVSAAAAMIFCATAGGMPESLFLALSFATVYFVFRLACEPEFRGRPVALLTKLIAALCLGLGLSALLLLPFLELMRIASDTHQLGNVHGQVGLTGLGNLSDAALYLVPMLLGPVGDSIYRGYWGVLPCFFSIVAIISLPLRRAAYPTAWRQLSAFFTICLVLLVLKRYGNPIINWIGGLPIAEMVVFYKYDEPLMALCVAMLAGIGFALVIEQRLRASHSVLALVLTTILLLGLAGFSLPRVLALKQDFHIFFRALVGGTLVIVAAAAWLALASRQRMRRWLAPGLLGLLIVELSFEFFLPSFYICNELPSQAANPYAGASYISFLHARDADYSRIFARENVLYPNWAGVFHLFDVRSLDAMEYRPYMAFIRSFLLKPGDEARISGDLADRFTGWDKNYTYDFLTDEERRFLSLSSVKYLISMSEYGHRTAVVDEIVAQHSSEKIWGFGPGIFPIGDGHTAEGLFQHPPSNRISYKTKIDPSRPVFTGILTMVEAAFGHSDGAGFTLEIKSGDKIEPLLHTEINPRDVPADRTGRRFSVDLSRYAGQDVDLLFSTDPGPNGDPAYDWVGWAQIGFQSKAIASGAAPSPFQQIYDHDVFIYQFSGALPRAALYSAAEVLPEADVLARLKAPGFDPERTVILGSESIPAGNEATIQSFVGGSASPVRAARITKYGPEHVRIETQTIAPAILMLNDADYPGWRATVNGTPVPIMRADYLFRGVIVPAGTSIVDFDYEPLSFRIGASVSGASLIAIVALPLITRRRRNRAATTNRADVVTNDSLDPRV